MSVLAGITSKPEVGLKCCLGNKIEREATRNLLEEKKPNLIIDLISLMTVHSLGVEDVVVEAFGKIGLAQSTIDYIREKVRNRKGIQSDGFSTLGKDEESGQFINVEVSEEDIKQDLEKLEHILEWIKHNCDVLPCNAALSMNREDKRHLNEMLSTCFIDTILIANEPGNALFSDDERLRSYAKTEYDVDGVWTQLVLMYCLGHGFLEKAKYDKITVKLASAYYFHTSVDADTLIEAAKQAEWKADYPFTTVVQILNGRTSDVDSALRVAVDFLYQLWRQSILPVQRDNLTSELMGSIIDGRNRINTLNLFGQYVQIRFVILPLAERQILATLETWKRTHIL